MMLLMLLVLWEIGFPTSSLQFTHAFMFSYGHWKTVHFDQHSCRVDGAFLCIDTSAASQQCIRQSSRLVERRHPGPGIAFGPKVFDELITPDLVSPSDLPTD